MLTNRNAEATAKADCALVLFEQGLRRGEIAERLSVKPANVPGMLQRARQRREKANGDAK